MSNPNESRARLIASAKKEFKEKGFAKASLRKISADAGLTTGAVYFFFQDKNGLLSAIVEEPLNRILAILREHLIADQDEVMHYEQHDGDHDAFAAALIGEMYADYDAMMILLHHAQGSAYENIVDRMIALLDEYYQTMAAQYAALFPGKRINQYMLHWFSHMQINAFVHLLEHEPDRAQALKKISPVLDFMVKGFMEYILEDDL